MAEAPLARAAQRHFARRRCRIPGVFRPLVESANRHPRICHARSAHCFCGPAADATVAVPARIGLGAAHVRTADVPAGPCVSARRVVLFSGVAGSEIAAGISRPVVVGAGSGAPGQTEVADSGSSPAGVGFALARDLGDTAGFRRRVLDWDHGHQHPALHRSVGSADAVTGASRAAHRAIHTWHEMGRDRRHHRDGCQLLDHRGSAVPLLLPVRQSVRFESTALLADERFECRLGPGAPRSGAVRTRARVGGCAAGQLWVIRRHGVRPAFAIVGLPGARGF